MRVLVVCLGNLCRSPMAEAVLRRKAGDAGLAIEVDSAGIEPWHEGSPPDPRGVAVAGAAGYDMSGQTARQIVLDDFHLFDRIYAMDATVFSRIVLGCPPSAPTRLALFDAPEEVHDPYYGDERSFVRTLAQIEAAADRILDEIARDAAPPPRG